MLNIADETDHMLLTGLSADDQQAFAAIYNRYWKTLYEYAFNILRQDEWAQDCVQEVFVSLWERRAVSRINSLEGYLRGAIRFQTLSAVRKRNMDQHFYQRLSRHLHHIFMEEPLLIKELELLYRDILHALPADQQKIFAMSRNQGMNYAQIARTLNISIKTVEKKISRSLRHIRMHSDFTGNFFLLVLAAFSEQFC